MKIEIDSPSAVSGALAVVIVLCTYELMLELEKSSLTLHGRAVEGDGVSWREREVEMREREVRGTDGWEGCVSMRGESALYFFKRAFHARAVTNKLAFLKQSRGKNFRVRLVEFFG